MAGIEKEVEAMIVAGQRYPQTRLQSRKKRVRKEQSVLSTLIFSVYQMGEYCYCLKAAQTPSTKTP